MQIHRQFIRTAKEYQSKTAIVDKTMDKRITYSKALIASLMLAKKFKAFDRGFMGIMLPTSAGCALSVLGTLMSGRTPVMINFSTGAEQNAKYAQGKCNFKTIITSKALLQKINCTEVPGMVYIEDIMAGISALDKIAAAVKSKLPASAILSSVHSGRPDETVAILFTSGSEKEPKAVELTHKNIMSNIVSITDAIALNDRDVFMSNLPFFHVFGLTACLWVPLYHGMTMVTYANPLDFKGVCNIVRDEGPTIMVGSPSFYWGYLRKSEPGDFKSVRMAVSGADKCPAPLREGFLKKHGMELFEGYGATETSPVVSFNRPGHNRPGSIGKPIKGVSVMIEDYETGAPCPTGAVGKILVKGDLIMKGYFDDLEETSLRIKNGWYDTGDMGYIDEDGYIWHSGRLKRFVKIGGEMVSLVKVENALEAVLPEDTLCCVVEVPDATKGARIAVALTEKVDEKAVLKEISKTLPNIALPKHFVYFDDLPKMGNGKIDFRTITDLVREKLQSGA